MRCEKPEKEVIFYGAGPYLAKNLKRLRKEGYAPVCVCDIDDTKRNRPFCGQDGLQVLLLDEALERFPGEPFNVTLISGLCAALFDRGVRYPGRSHRQLCAH